MEVSLLDFVHECKQLAKQALGKHAGELAGTRGRPAESGC